METEYEKVLYSKGQIKKAGETLAGCSETELIEHKEQLAIVDNWRAAHAFPLDQIHKAITKALSKQEGIMYVRRLKRLDSIVGKLRRSNHTALHKMQDLGGCRIIVPAVQDVYYIVGKLKECLEQQGYEIDKENDYLDMPPEKSGYRSYHLVIKYHGPNSYDGMLIEIQVRTKLQNSWATAVEIIDCITENSLKAGTGNERYRYFFKLVSGLFSIKEATSIVNGIPKEQETIVREIYQIEKEERINEKLSAYSAAINLAGSIDDGLAAYYLFIIDMQKHAVNVQPFKQSQIKEAVEYYHEREKHLNKQRFDVVLVAGQSFSSIKESYQNYFFDSQLFLTSVSEMCSVYPEEYPEESSIKIDLTPNSRSITELFTIERYKRSTPPNIHLQEDGVGIRDSEVVYCPDWRSTLPDSYLRFSGIYMDATDLCRVEGVAPIQVHGPGIVVSDVGASFIVDKEEWSCLSESNILVIQPRENTSRDDLLLLLCWIKSNVQNWDMIWNRRKNSVFFDAESLRIPILKGNDLSLVMSNVEMLLSAEKHFVDMYQEEDNEAIHDIFEEIEKFNNNILKYLRAIESIFNKFFSITPEKEKVIAHELKLKGLFSYIEP